MMAEVWLSYRLSDFVMFSERVYQRQIQLHNESWLGLQAVALVLAGAILWHALKPSGRSPRMIPILLALAWFWVGWSFLWERYGEINLLALYAAPAFALQGLAFLAVAALPDGLRVELPRNRLRVPAIPLLFTTLLFLSTRCTFDRPTRDEWRVFRAYAGPDRAGDTSGAIDVRGTSTMASDARSICLVPVFRSGPLGSGIRNVLASRPACSCCGFACCHSAKA